VTVASEDPVVGVMREEITALDVALLATINARIRAVSKLRLYKTEQGIDFFDPTREVWLVRHLKDANAGPLSEAGVEEFFAFVLELVKQEVARD
jgi:chorismate mutase